MLLNFCTAEQLHGTSALWPIYLTQKETLEHLTCLDSATQDYSDNQLNLLATWLKNISITPAPIVNIILHSFQAWLSPVLSTRARAPTAGSLKGPDILITSAFYHDFGCCLGRLSKTRAESAVLYSTQESNGLYRLSLLFLATRAYHNKTVHSTSTKDHCRAFRNEISSALPSLPLHLLVIVTPPLALLRSFSKLALLIRTSKEALSQQNHILHQKAHVFFPPRFTMLSTSSTSKSSYAPSIMTLSSHYTTTLTTKTTNSSSIDSNMGLSSSSDSCTTIHTTPELPSISLATLQQSPYPASPLKQMYLSYLGSNTVLIWYNHTAR